MAVSYGDDYTISDNHVAIQVLVNLADQAAGVALDALFRATVEKNNLSASVIVFTVAKLQQ
jgi:hypothetical protein